MLTLQRSSARDEGPICPLRHSVPGSGAQRSFVRGYFKAPAKICSTVTIKDSYILMFQHSK